MLVREAEAADSGAIAPLLTQLGYPTGSEAVEARLAGIRAGTGVMFVAVDGGRVLGLIGCQLFPVLHADQPVALLTVLIVDEAHRGRGVGRVLVSAADAWAMEQGAGRIFVTSALHRTDAHSFYERIGYERTGVRLGRTLPRPHQVPG